uniref:Neuroblast differentiation-associated protein AHNAK-like n=1 Tax=Scophthalmus maximus TaxID=52904 RepID=A0A8D3DA84_SCOMX
MREQGKTKRRGDARISWPKFPSFGKGRKSHFTRSHSSSEADEQRKLELSPTTSDTESPIKTQDALKGKKRHKMKLSALKKRGRVSSSEDQETDAPTIGQISGDIYQTASDMLSPDECFESLSGKAPEVYVSKNLKVVEEIRLEQNDPKKTVQHKVELISIDSTLKTADLTMALADQESPSGIKSPDEKKKKKDRSEIKVKILGKDKSHKKDTKAKASPKRLKTLGASTEVADQPANEKSDVIPKVEFDFSDVTFMRRSPQKGEEQAKKDKDIKQKQEAKTGPTFKLPKIGLSDISTEETIQKLNVEECPNTIEKLNSAVKEDPYDRLSKSSHSRTQLPKREDIEIPGMEDMSVRTRAKGIKEPKVVLTGQYEEFQTETVQLLIDVDSVKEAVSKLPGFKLPKVDTCGMPIPEEITVIDANAQRISVKTPTKVADTKTKHEAHLTKFDITASSEITKTTVKLPKIATANLTSEGLLIETKVVKEMEKVDKTKLKQSDIEFYKREDITIPGKESPKKDIVFKLPKQNIFEEQGDSIFGERTILLQEVTTPETETRKGKGQIGGVTLDVKIPEIDSIEFIDSVNGSPAKKGGGVSLTGFGVNLNATKPKVDISFPQTESEVKDVGAEEHTIKLAKFGAVRINVPDLKGSKTDSGLSKKDATATLPEVQAGVKLSEAPEVDVTLGSIDVSIPEQKVEVEKPSLEIKPLQMEVDIDGQGSKLKMPKFGIKMPRMKGPEFDLSLSKKDVDVTLPEAKAGVKLPDAPKVDVTLGSIDVSIPEQRVEVEKPELEIKPLQTEVEIEGQGSRFKMPKFGIKMPKMKGPEFELSLSKEDVDVTLPEAKAGVKLPGAPEVDATLGSIDTEVEFDGQGSRFKMPKFGIKMPKIKGPEFDLSSSKKDIDVTLPKAKAGVKLPEAPKVDVTLGSIDVSIQEQKVEVEKPELEMKPLQTEVEFEGQGSRFKMPKFGIKMPKIKGPEFDLSSSKKDVDVTLPEAKAGVKLPETAKVDVTLGSIDVSIPEQKVEVEKPELEIKPLQTEFEFDGHGSRFKMPKFGIKMPKIKGPEFDLSSSKRDVDITLPEAKAGVKLPDAPKVDVTLGSIDVSIPEQRVEVEKPELEIKPLQTEVEFEGQGSRFKMPKFGIKMPKMKGPEFELSLSKKDVDVTLPEAKAGVKLPETAKVDVTLGSIDVSIPEFKMPKFGIKMPKIKGPEFDLSLSKKDVDVTLPEAKAGVKLPETAKVDVTLGSIDVSIPEQKVEVEKPELEIKPLQTEVEFDGHGSRFKMPKFGIKMPKIKGPEFDLRSSKRDVDITLPEAKAGVKLPDAPKVDVTLGSIDVSIPEQRVEVEKPELEIKPLQTEVEFEGQGSRFKMPKFGIKMPKMKGPEFELSLSKKDVDVTLPEAKAGVKLPEAPNVDATFGSIDVDFPVQKMEVNKPELQIKPLQTEGEHDGQGSKFKMPELGITMPKVRGPEIDLSLSKKDIHATLPKAEAQVKLPVMEHRESGIKVEVKAPEIAVHQQDVEGSPLKFKMPTFKLPKFGVGTPNISVEGPDMDKDVKIDGADIKMPKDGATINITAPSVEDEDVTFPEAKAEVKLPEAPKIAVEMKSPVCEVEIDRKGEEFNMPKFGMSMPKVKGPEFHLGFSKKDVNVTLPEAKADVNLPDVELQEPSAKVEIKAPAIKVAAKDTGGSPSKFKMPSFSFSKPKVKGPVIDLSLSKKDTDITLQDTNTEVKLPEVAKIDVSLGKAEVLIPEAKVEVKKPEVQIKPQQTDVELEGQGGKFKMPKFGITMPKVKGPDFDLSFSKKDVDVTLPKAKAEVETPDTPKITVDVKPLECEAEIDGQGSKFNMPKFGISMPKVQGPKIDLSVSKKDVDVKLPEAKADLELKAPEIDVNLGKAEVSIPEAKMEVEKPELEIKPLETEGELDGQGNKFKMPKFGISMPKVKGPEIDFSISKKDVDISLPEAKTEINLPDVELKEPSAKVEVKAPEIEAQLGSMKGSPSKFKMPTFKFPKFGVAAPNVSAEIPDTNKEIKIDGAHMNISAPHTDIDVPEVKGEVYLQEAEVKEPLSDVEVDAKIKKSRFSMPKFSFSKPSVKAPEVDLSVQDVNVALPEGKVEVKIGEVDMKSPEHEAEVDGQGSKFKMPKFGISMPKVTGPDIDLSLSKKDVDVTIPEAKAQVKLPDVDLKGPSAEVEIQHPEMKVVTKDKDGSPSKYKMPTFKLPKFGVGTPSSTIEVRDMEKDVKINDVDINIPEEVLAVHIVAPSIDTEGKSIDLKTTTTEDEEKGSKFKLPKFGISMPKVTGPDIDLSLSKKDVDVTIPEAKAEVKLPDVDLKGPSAEVEIKHPEMKVVTKDKEGSPSKYKMPTFKFPKFGVGTPSSTIEVPDIDKDVKINDVDINIPEEVLAVNIVAPSIDTEGKSIDLKTTTTGDEEKGSKFKLPKFGISMPKVTGPDIDLSLSKKDVDVTIPEAKAEVKLPDVDLKGPSAEVEIKHPEMKVVTKDKEGSPSKYKMPTFKFPKFGVGTPSSTIEVPDIDKEVKIHDVDINIPEEVLAVNIVAPTIDTEGKSIDLKTTTTGDEEKGSKFKLPKFGISMPKVTGPDIDLSLSKKDVDVTIPGVKAEVKLPDVDLKEPSAEVEIKPPEIKVVTKDKEGSPSKFKMPTFKFPKFGVGTPSSTIEVPDMDKDVKINDADINIPEEVLAVHIVAPSIDTEGKSMDLKTTTTGHEEKGSPDIDSSLSKTAVDVTIPEAKADVQLPDVELKGPLAKVEIKAPGIEVHTSNVEGSPSKFKMPTFKLPKFGAATPQVSVEVPDVDKDIKVDGSDLKLPKAKVEVTRPDVEIKEPVGSISVSQASIAEGDAKLKKPRFSLPKFSFSKQSTKELEFDVSVPEVDVSLPKGNVEVIPSEVELKAPEGDVEVDGLESKFKMPKFGITMPKVKGPDVDLSFSKKDVNVTQTKAEVEVDIPEGPKIDVDVKPLESEAEIDGQGGKFKMPKFGISMPKVKGPEIDLSLSKKDLDVTLPEAKAEVQLTDVEIKQPSGKVDAKAPEIKGQTSIVEGSPSKLKMPTFTLPKFGAATPKVSVQVPDVDKDIQIDGAKMEVTKEGAIVNVTAPSIDAEGLSVDVKPKESELEGSESRFKMPKFGISMPKVKGPEIDLSLSKKDGDVTLPEAKTEVKLPSFEVKEPKGDILVPDAPTVETEAKLKRPNWTFPKFSFSRTSGKAHDGDMNLETPKADVTSPEVKAEMSLPDVEVKGPSGIISMEEQPAEELDGNLKKSKFSLPKFSFSKSSVNIPEVSAELPQVDVFLPEGELRVRQPVMEIKAPELEAEHDVQGSKFKLPKFGISLPKSEGPEVDLNASQKGVDVTIPHRAEVKLPEADVKESPASVETEAKLKDVGGSPSKFKMPTLKMPKFGGASYDVTVEATGPDKAENYGAKLEEDVTVKIKGPSIDIKTDMPKAVMSDSEKPKTETDSVGQGSPSRFKLPLFKMPNLGFSKSKPEDECVPADNEGKDNQLVTEEESKSPKLTLTSFGEILNNFDVEFDVSKTDDGEQNLKAIKEVDETSEPGGKQLEEKETQSNTKQDTTKSPEKTSWFKFPKFGLSSPSEPAKISEKDEHKDEKTPVDETGTEEMSPTSSIQSSDAFADVSSTMTSEYFCPSASSPTKVTAKYSDPSAATEIEETHTNIITSTTRTALISVEPNMPEKITILSSGVSSSSEDTLKLESGKIHVITTNIQATPEAQHAKLLTAVQVQSSEGLPLQSEDREAASWTVEDSQSGKRRVFERHFVRETSSERSESKETIVITKQITHIFDSSEPISGDTASSIQRLKDSMHSEKMRFFDGAEK